MLQMAQDMFKNFQDRVPSTLNAMADLVDSGQIGAVGISNFPAPMMRRAHAALARRGIPLASNQVKVSLLNRRIETLGTLKTARELGMTIIAWSPLEMGVLTGKFHKDPSLLKSRPIGRIPSSSDRASATLPKT